MVFPRLNPVAQRLLSAAAVSHPMRGYHCARPMLETPKGPPKGFGAFQRAKKEEKAPAPNVPKEEKTKEPEKETPKAESKKPRPDSERQRFKPKENKPKEEEEDDDPLGESKKRAQEIAARMAPFVSTGIAIGAAIAAWQVVSTVSAPPPMAWGTLQQYIAADQVSRIISPLDGGLAQVELGGLSDFSGTARKPTVQVGSPEAFELRLEVAQAGLGKAPDQFINVFYKKPTDWGLLWEFVLQVGFMGLIVMLMRGMGNAPLGGMLGMGQKKFKFVDPANVKTTFKDVAGLAEPKQEIMELVDFLKHPQKYRELGAKIPKGAMLVGPPGVGKTLLAKATAGEAGVPFVSVAGSDFVEVFGGVGPRRVRDLFATARKHAPCIIFIDEIDAIGRQRGKGIMRNDERESTLNAMLVEMDGFNTEKGVVVLAGTNRPDVLDKALTRPGRFDRQIPLELPPMADREEIFNVHLTPLRLDPSLTKDGFAKRLAALTPGFSGADIMNVCNEAALIAARESAEHITLLHFDKAVERVIGGLEKRESFLSPWERKVVAHHEAGHAVVGWFLQNCDPLLKVSIHPRGKALGFAQYLPRDAYIKTFDQLFDRMCLALGGRAAEKVIFQHLSSGAADDLRRVTDDAYKMVKQYGMDGEVGHLSFAEPDESSFTTFKPYSHLVERRIDEAANALVAKAYEKAEQLVIEKRPLLERLASILLEKECLRAEDLMTVLGERPGGMTDEYKQAVHGSPAVSSSAAEAKSEPPKAE
eukprot:TRINITY_DN317_c0_g1_i3.p1 TRINITY_DN317_c0_g1~~TRINITY_DN317_c0_g1_i3.p1  ORF type:complete len:757 (-),score=137.79 TRINITY_DN317_c0_g1_i3:6-2276(-)